MNFQISSEDIMYHSLVLDDLPDLDIFDDEYMMNEIDKSIFNGECINGPLNRVFYFFNCYTGYNNNCPFLLNEKVNYKIAKYFIEKYKDFNDFNINYGYYISNMIINGTCKTFYHKSEIYLFSIKDNSIFELLLQNGANPNAFLNFDRYSNLLSSIEDIDKIKLLLKYGAVIENKLKVNNKILIFNNLYMETLNIEKLIIFLKSTQKELSEDLIEFFYKNNFKNKIKIKDRNEYSFLLKQTFNLKNKQKLFSLIEKN